jgi:hypothetical protein
MIKIGIIHYMLLHQMTRNIKKKQKVANFILSKNYNLNKTPKPAKSAWVLCRYCFASTAKQDVK